eukprot:24020-Eustigmatos_ZCMA.PRE.1
MPSVTSAQNPFAHITSLLWRAEQDRPPFFPPRTQRRRSSPVRAWSCSPSVGSRRNHCCVADNCNKEDYAAKSRRHG